eukprot:scaffold289953_cov13-Tisochrysis_lutea.AAC.1
MRSLPAATDAAVGGLRGPQLLQAAGIAGVEASKRLRRWASVTPAAAEDLDRAGAWEEAAAGVPGVLGPGEACLRCCCCCC